jgi:hypothetical protein
MEQLHSHILVTCLAMPCHAMACLLPMPTHLRLPSLCDHSMLVKLLVMECLLLPLLRALLAPRCTSLPCLRSLDLPGLDSTLCTAPHTRSSLYASLSLPSSLHGCERGPTEGTTVTVQWHRHTPDGCLGPFFRFLRNSSPMLRTTPSSACKKSPCRGAALSTRGFNSEGTFCPVLCSALYSAPPSLPTRIQVYS